MDHWLAAAQIWIRAASQTPTLVVHDRATGGDFRLCLSTTLSNFRVEGDSQSGNVQCIAMIILIRTRCAHSAVPPPFLRAPARGSVLLVGGL